MGTSLTLDAVTNIKIEIDFNRNGDFDHLLSDVTLYVRDSLFFSAGWFNVGQVESNVAAHVAPVNSMRLILDNRNRTFSYEYISGDLYNQLSAGLMVRLSLNHSALSFSWTYFTKSIKESTGQFGDHTVIVDCVCAMPRIQQANYEPVVTQNISTSEALEDMMEAGTVIMPYTSDYFVINGSLINGPSLIFDPTTDVPPMIDFEAGYSELDYVGDVLYRDRKGISIQKAQLFIADICMGEAYGRFFYQPRDAKFHFHNRYHDKLQPSQITIGTSDYLNGVSRSSPVYNQVRLHYQPREIGTPNSRLFLSGSVPIILQHGQHRRIRCRFSDPDNEMNKVASIDITDPVIGSDIIVKDQSGADVTRFVYKSADLKGAGGELFFDNDTGETVTIEKIQVRGTPILLSDEEIATSASGESMIAYNWQSMPDLKGAYITDSEFAQNVVDFLILRHGTMRRVLETISIIITDDNFSDIMPITIGDVVRIQDDWSGHDNEYVILGETHTYNLANNLWKVQWALRSNDTTPFFLIGTSEINGPDVIGY